MIWSDNYLKEKPARGDASCAGLWVIAWQMQKNTWPCPYTPPPIGFYKVFIGFYRFSIGFYRFYIGFYRFFMCFCRFLCVLVGFRAVLIALGRAALLRNHMCTDLIAVGELRGSNNYIKGLQGGFLNMPIYIQYYTILIQFYSICLVCLYYVYSMFIVCL